MNEKGYNDYEGYLKGLIEKLYPSVDWLEPNPAERIGIHCIIPDGRIGDEWVIELEGVKGLKQTRGALVDLAVFPCHRKLLVVLFAPVPGSDMTSDSIEQHLTEVASRIGSGQVWCIVALNLTKTKEEHLSKIGNATRLHGLEPHLRIA